MKDAVDLLGERITELEAKLKAAEEWKAEARVLLSVATACRSYPDFTWSEFKERRDALLAQEGGE